MKIYYGERLEKPIILENGICRGKYEYYIITLGSHPCCYVLLPEGHKHHGKFYDDIPIECHGGLTYSEPTLFRDNIIRGGEWVIGWDYAHLGDYVSYKLPFVEGSAGGHKFTLEELRRDVIEVAEQLIMEECNEGRG